MSKPNGVILYRGPSLIDGSPIVAIAVGLNRKSHNVKTGGMLQTYILRSDVDPIRALKRGLDSGICGDCPHRGVAGKERTCYVSVGQGPLGVYRAFKRRLYPRIKHIPDLSIIGVSRYVRLGTYGDPAAVPVQIWEALLQGASGHTGYTHQWRSCDRWLKQYCMASVDTVAEANEAHALGWRTFRVNASGITKLPGEAVCPASAEAGHKLQCEECLACCGASSGRRGSIVINLHGGFAVLANREKLNQRLWAIPVRHE